jgi:hypothetical protein
MQALQVKYALQNICAQENLHIDWFFCALKKMVQYNTKSKDCKMKAYHPNEFQSKVIF